MINQTNPEHAAIIERLAQMLAELPVEGTLAYSMASAAVNRDLQGKYRYLLEAAKKRTEKDLGCIFECVRTVGIKRAAPNITPAVGLAAIRHVRKHTTRAKKRIDRVQTNSLTESEHRAHIATSAHLGALAMMADGRKTKALSVVADVVKPIPPANVLAMFQK